MDTNGFAIPSFVEYDVEYTNIKPWNNSNVGSGKIRISLPRSSGSPKAKLKRAIERKINSLGVRIDSFTEVS